MTFEHLANLFYNWGYEVKMEHYFLFRNYLLNMLNRDRVLIVKSGQLIEAIATYYLTNDYTKIYKKHTWDLVDDEPDGKQVYVDKMVCRRYSRFLRNLIGSSFEERFPKAEMLVYHRAPKDRCVKVERRSVHELQSTVS